MVSRNFILPVIEDQLWRANIVSAENAAESWNSKWGWILKEHEDFNKKLKEVSKNSALLKNISRKETPDTRTIKPIPETMNGRYGWILSKEEFKLEKYGPEVFKAKPLLD